MNLVENHKSVGLGLQNLSDWNGKIYMIRIAKSIGLEYNKSRIYGNNSSGNMFSLYGEKYE